MAVLSGNAGVYNRNKEDITKESFDGVKKAFGICKAA